jgi:hypothetical protein
MPHITEKEVHDLLCIGEAHTALVAESCAGGISAGGAPLPGTIDEALDVLHAMQTRGLVRSYRQGKMTWWTLVNRPKTEQL